MRTVLGINAVLRYGPAGTRPTARLPRTADVEVSREWSTADGTTRDSGGWRENVPVLKDASLSITVKRNGDDAAFRFFVEALESGLPVALFADDGNGYGLDGDWSITQFNDDQPLENLQTLTVTATPAGRMNEVKGGAAPLAAPAAPPEEENPEEEESPEE